MTEGPYSWRFSFVDAGSIRLRVAETGNPDRGARTLVLVHGLGHWIEAAWNELVPQLDPALRIVAFDLPGFGASDKPDTRYDTGLFSRALDAVLADHVPGAFDLVGHSLGGYIAAVYAAAHPQRVRSLTLIAPAGFLRAARFVYALLGSQLARWLFLRKPSRAFVNRMLDQSVADPAAIAAPIRSRACELAGEPAVRRAFAGVYVGAMQDFANATALHARLRTYAGPVAIVWGRHDRFIPIKGLAPALAVYPHAVVTRCERSGHLPMVEQPVEVANAIGNLLRSTPVMHEKDSFVGN